MLCFMQNFYRSPMIVRKTFERTEFLTRGDSGICIFAKLHNRIPNNIVQMVFNME